MSSESPLRAHDPEDSRALLATPDLNDRVQVALPVHDADLGRSG